MSELRSPIAEQLESEVPDADVRRLWLGIEARRKRRFSGWSTLLNGRGALVAAAIAAVVLLVLFGRNDAAPGGPLLKTNGQAPLALGGPKAEVAPLADGSQITLNAGSKLEVLDNDGRRFVSVLRSGTAHFEVKPGGERRWIVEAGLASVEVVGTGFSVTRSEQRVEVSVSHGVVLVRAALVPDGVQRLTAGQKLVVRGAGASAAAAGSAPTSIVSQASGPVSPQVPFDVIPAPASAAPPVRSRSERADHWLAEADVARRAGNVEGAITLLRRALDEAEGNRAALTAFTLGKLLLDSAGRPSEAEAAFARCLALSPPVSIAEDALARLTEAQARAGRKESARNSAAEYVRLYPNGRRLREVQRWASVP